MPSDMDIMARIAVGAYAACRGPCTCCARVNVARAASCFADSMPYDPNNDDGEHRMALDRPTKPVGMGGPNLPPWSEDDFCNDHPSLTSFLKDEKWSDGTRRMTGTLSFFVQDGVLKASINDRDRGVVAFVSAPAFYELLFLIDQGIKADSLEWRAAARTTQGKTPPF